MRNISFRISLKISGRIYALVGNKNEFAEKNIKRKTMKDKVDEIFVEKLSRVGLRREAKERKEEVKRQEKAK